LIWLTFSASARSDAKLNHSSGGRLDQVGQYNLTGPYEKVLREGPGQEGPPIGPSGSLRRPVGSALSPNYGIGVGESIDVTYNDMQYGFPTGRYISHYWNGQYGEDAQVGVHFAYESCSDTLAGDPLHSVNLSGYNLYDATGGGDWPRGQDDGCELEINDQNGTGQWVDLDVMGNGTAVLASTSRFFTPATPDNRIYYQGVFPNCLYNAELNTSYIDPTIYRLNFSSNISTNYSVQAQVQTQFDGGNTIVHVLLGEQDAMIPPATDDYVDNVECRVFAHYRKVGELPDDGTWSAGQIIDTIVQIYGTNGVTLMPSPYSPNVCVSYSNPTVQGRRLENSLDVDVFYRESSDYGLTWNPKVNVTNFDNATEGSSAHFKAWVESPCLYDSNDDLHIIWTGTPTSANPYYDGFEWNFFDTDIYHWARSTNEIVRVANGSFLNDDWLSGGIPGFHCGYGDEKTGYIAFIWISECDGKLYCIWNQIHERANRMEWRNSTIVPVPGVLDDCAYTRQTYGGANWEILMSVAYIESSSLWDYPRNISNTYTPDCGLPGDELATGGPCGNEWKPAIEKYAFDEAGLELTWPEGSIVDMTPEGSDPYTGDWYLNLEYIDDQFPGGSFPNSRGHTDFYSLNSEKWVRLACVDPVEASVISATPRSVDWPRWAKIGEVTNFRVIVKNEGNVALNIDEIGKTDVSWLDVSEHPTPGAPLVVDAGVENTDTFNIVVNTATISQTSWLDGEIWLKSDAFNTDSLSIPIHILAADTVEPVVWDTVMTAENMYNPFLNPYGTCVGLAVGNTGELGWGGGSDGRVNLDYTDAVRMDVSRRECDTSIARNRMYLISQTPFTILANASDGSGAELSLSFNDLNQADEGSFDPTNAKGSLTGGLTAGGTYDSTYTGRFVNRDTTIAMERIVYGPRSATPATDTINFVIVYTKVYSADGQPHNHLTIGNASDWDVPANNPPNNMGGVYGGFVYLQGTDTTNSDHCSSHTGRFATEAFGGGYTSVEFQANDCVNNATYTGANAVYQLLMEDTSFWGSTPVSPPSPNPLTWWQMTAVSGPHLDPVVPDTGMDLAVFLTYKHDYDLGNVDYGDEVHPNIAPDTLHYWTVMTTTPIGGTLSELAAQVAYAKRWYTETVRNCSASCCVGRVGNANGQGEYPDEITLGDIMLLVDVKFISGDCTKLTCIAECDVTQDGGANPSCEENVTLGDIMTLVDFLFITGPDVAVLKTCL
jgi:hypothetical protein